MNKLSRKQIEIIFVFLGVVLVTSGIYSTVVHDASFMSILYLAVGFYLIIVSVVRINKLDKLSKNSQTKIKVSSKVEKPSGKANKKP